MNRVALGPQYADGMDTSPPTNTERLPYRLLTGTDDRAFCQRVSAALAEGYRLYGSPAISFGADRVLTAQAVVLDELPGQEATL